MSVVSLLFAPEADSQQLTTVTTYNTTTFTSVLSSFATGYITTVAATTFTTSYSVSLEPPSPQYCGTYTAVPLFYVGQNPSSNKFHISISSTRSVDLLLFASTTDELVWETSGPGCDVNKVASAVVKEAGISNYSFDWVPPSPLPNGNPVLVLSYTQRGLNGNADITVTYQVLGSESVTKAITSGSTETLVLTNTLTSRTIREVSYNEILSRWVADNPLLLALGVGIGLAIVIVAALISGSRARQATAGKSKSKLKAHKEIQFCLNCGAELPLKSKFCNKCGSPQS